jgi:hypothetical protein
LAQGCAWWCTGCEAAAAWQVLFIYVPLLLPAQHVEDQTDMRLRGRKM